MLYISSVEFNHFNYCSKLIKQKITSEIMSTIVKLFVYISQYMTNKQ
jgi:hypothetical protein